MNLNLLNNLRFKKKKFRNIPQLIADHLGERILSPSVQNMVSLIERGIGRGMPSSSNQEMQLEPMTQPILTQLEPSLATPRPVGRPRNKNNRRQ